MPLLSRATFLKHYPFRLLDGRISFLLKNYLIEELVISTQHTEYSVWFLDSRLLDCFCQIPDQVSANIRLFVWFFCIVAAVAVV